MYKYVHPEKGCVYIGRTTNLKRRIQCHNTNPADNIDRAYEEMLNECDVYYLELANKAEAIAVEAYLINEQKPMLNKALIYDHKTLSLTMQLPPWHHMRISHDIIHTKNNKKQIVSTISTNVIDIDRLTAFHNARDALLFLWEQTPLGARDLIRECIAVALDSDGDYKTLRHIMSISADVLLRKVGIEKSNDESYTDCFISQISSALDAVWIAEEHEDGGILFKRIRWFQNGYVDERHKLVCFQFSETVISDYLEHPSEAFLCMIGLKTKDEELC